MNLLPLQAGDVPDTWANIEDLTRDVGYTPATPVAVGIRNFVDWYLEYYKGGEPPATKVVNLG
jgi:UDP-glucuronate 4-epimerase